MLNKIELEKFGQTLGFNLWQTERDYFQHLFLMFLSRRTSNELIFKGGTALQKVFGLNRFSIDLDFTLNETLPSNLFENIISDFTNFGIKVKYEPITQKNSLKVKLAFQGPSYEGTERTLTILRVEISLREKVLLESETKEISSRYPDLQPYLIKVMNLEEIMAEKIRTILTRDKARDIFDVRFLLNKRVNINEKLVNEKLKLYGLTYSKKLLLERLLGMEKVWHNELSQLMENIPEFKTVIREIKEKI